MDLKKFTSIHKRLTVEMNGCLKQTNIPEWMIKGKTTLIQKDVQKEGDFLQPFSYWTGINNTFTFCTTNVFGCFGGVIPQFKLVKHKFPNLAPLHVDLSAFQITYGLKKRTYCQRTNYHITVNQVSTTAWTAFVTWYTRCKFERTKTFDSI